MELGNLCVIATSATCHSGMPLDMQDLRCRLRCGLGTQQNEVTECCGDRIEREELDFSKSSRQ